MTQRYVVVGGGLAGAKTVEALREHDSDAEITIVGTEDLLPYERPPLSKEYLAGDKVLADFTVHDDEWYRDNRIDIRRDTTVTGLDRAARAVTLSDGSTLTYDALALATGSSSFVPPLDGVDADGVHVLRTYPESTRLREALGRGRLAVVGGGWIGLEVAAVARGLGTEVTVVETEEHVLGKALGPTIGDFYARVHRNHGVDLRTGVRVARITVDDGAATGIELESGERIAADTVLVAVGARPNVDLAVDAGLDVDDGVLTDASLRTSDPAIVAVGDIANAENPALGTRIRVEHWANALHQPAVAAVTMTGGDATYDRLPYFFSDQYDVGMEFVGTHDADATVVVRGDMDAGEFLAFWLDGSSRVTAGMNVDIWDAGDDIRALISSDAPVDPARLADTSVALSDVLGS